MLLEGKWEMPAQHLCYLVCEDMLNPGTRESQSHFGGVKMEMMGKSERVHRWSLGQADIRKGL